MRAAAGEPGQRTLAFFADRVEGNLLAAHQELQKLALLHPAGELSFEQVEAAVLNVARYDVTQLSEAVWSGQVARALRMLEGLRAEGVAAVMVHWLLAASVCDGINKGLRHPEWPHEPWDALRRLVLMFLQSSAPSTPRPSSHLALHA